MPGGGGGGIAAGGAGALEHLPVCTGGGGGGPKNPQGTAGTLQVRDVALSGGSTEEGGRGLCSPAPPSPRAPTGGPHPGLGRAALHWGIFPPHSLDPCPGPRTAHSSRAGVTEGRACVLVSEGHLHPTHPSALTEPQGAGLLSLVSPLPEDLLCGLCGGPCRWLGESSSVWG